MRNFEWKKSEVTTHPIIGSNIDSAWIKSSIVPDIVIGVGVDTIYRGIEPGVFDARMVRNEVNNHFETWNRIITHVGNFSTKKIGTEARSGDQQKWSMNELTTFVSLGDELIEIIQGPVGRVDILIIWYVEPWIREWRGEDRIQPYRLYA